MNEGTQVLLDAAIEIGEVLTPEQRETLAELHRERRERWRH